MNLMALCFEQQRQSIRNIPVVFGNKHMCHGVPSFGALTIGQASKRLKSGVISGAPERT
jgi:hypothetical protein